MSINNSYFSKNNTIISNSYTNTGRNPVTEIFYVSTAVLDYPNGYSRFIFDIDFTLLNEKITLSLALQLCSNISFVIFEEYTNLILKNKLKESICLIYKIYDKGYSVIDILDNYFIFIKSTNILTEEQKYNIIPLICKYISIFHNIHEDEIELSLFTNNLINVLA